MGTGGLSSGGQLPIVEVSVVCGWRFSVVSYPFFDKFFEFM